MAEDKKSKSDEPGKQLPMHERWASDEDNGGLPITVVKPAKKLDVAKLFKPKRD